MSKTAPDRSLAAITTRLRAAPRHPGSLAGHLEAADAAVATFEAAAGGPTAADGVGPRPGRGGGAGGSFEISPSASDTQT